MCEKQGRLRILVVDDEQKQRQILKILLNSEGYEVRTADSVETALERMEEKEPDIVITDLRMEGQDGIALLEQTKWKYPNCKVILLTGYGSIENAVEAMKKGAWFYFVKGKGPEELLAELRKLQNAYLSKQNGKRLQEENRNYMLDTKNEELRKIFRIVERAAKSSANILILGESGVGKEVFANYIHQLSRPDRKFLAVNCHALSDSLMESELFGHEKGAFTGAIGTYKGRFEAAEGGTLFLDEIGDIPRNVQSKLLRTLETRTIERVGSTQSIPVDFRLISATNVDLEQAMKDGDFRSDLYYRLCTITIVLPPLRERKEDLPAYNYKGNIRELKNVIERLVVLSEDGTVSLEDLPDQFFEKKMPVKESFGGSSLKEVRMQAEKELILEVLQMQQCKTKETAEHLGISERQLFNKLKEYEIDLKKLKMKQKEK